VPILVLDSEQLIGARQKRVTNRSIILLTRAKTNIRVSCMKQGRWRLDSDHFDPGPQNAPSKVRRRTRTREALNRVHERRMRGYVLDAVGAAPATAEESVAPRQRHRGAASRFAGGGAREISSAHGRGNRRELRADDNPMHVSAIRAEAHGDGGGVRAPQPIIDPIAPPSRRRGRRR
jgi:hypothetical protein